jgi:type VI protein secretion system component VasK
MTIIVWCLIWIVIVTYGAHFLGEYGGPLLSVAGDVLLIGGALLVVVALVYVWWVRSAHQRELDRVRKRKERSRRKLDAFYQQVATRMDDIGRQNPAGGQLVLKHVRSNATQQKGIQS